MKSPKIRKSLCVRNFNQPVCLFENKTAKKSNPILTR